MRHPLQQTLCLMANRKPIYHYFDINHSIRKFWFKSESLIKYLIFKFYGLKPVDLPSRYQNKVNRLRISLKSNGQSNLNESLKLNVNQIKNANQIRNLSKRLYIDRLISGPSSNAPAYLKKWRKTLKSDLTNFALISLVLQNSTTEEEMQWTKLNNLLKQLINEDYKSDQLNKEFNDEIFKLENIMFDRYIGKGCNAAIYEISLKEPLASQNIFKDKQLAVKMLFNYDIESNAVSIMKAMSKECIPFPGNFGNEIDNLLNQSSDRTKLTSHPNIVRMYGVFVDQVPELSRAKELFRNALPPRLDERGFGRNMTLFLVMKRYKCNLKEYLQTNYPNPDQSLSLLTQLLNGVEFLVSKNVAHRDLKTDNLLLDFDLDQNYPTLVLTDFGLCSTSLTIPYLTDEMTITGNRCLTAPEIITSTPGMFSVLNYSKSDLWACGTIAYEIFNNSNPFYQDRKNGFFLNSYSYNESELPKPSNMPIYIERVIREILNRDPSKRPEIETCTTLCNLSMFCDELSLRFIANSRLKKKDLIKKINLLLSDTLFFASKKLNKMQLKLKLMFLINLKFANVKEAIKYFEI